ncbi:hypothetical protein [Neptuniibacter sp. QD37_11]|uniref:hypothetical protein n=1 Tax=Neptuniibacter sp. QD37_11 TaxID=3398209 RepID=UPI0039F5D2E7
MSIREAITLYAQEHSCDVTFLEDFDEAIIGLHERVDQEVGNPLFSVTYSMGKILSIMMQRADMTEAEALDDYEYNVGGLYTGPNSPTIIDDISFKVFES